KTQLPNSSYGVHEGCGSHPHRPSLSLLSFSFTAVNQFPSGLESWGIPSVVDEMSSKVEQLKAGLSGLLYKNIKLIVVDEPMTENRFKWDNLPAQPKMWKTGFWLKQL
ncbi:hypothetical protein Pfo_018549, partial [Paulownia fortunei]